MDITLTPLAENDVTVLPPDIVWSGVSGDFAMAIVPEDGGVGGFAGVNPIASAALMLLFSDARPLSNGLSDIEDPRGWIGDGFDVDTKNGEAPLGSTLWRFNRALVDDDGVLARKIKLAAEAALQPLKTQGVIDRIEIEAEVVRSQDRIALQVDLIARDRTVFSKSFDPLWGRSDGGV